MCPSLLLWYISFSSFTLFLTLSMLYSSRIGIVLARHPLLLNLSLQGLSANNPSLFYWRKSICGCHCLFFSKLCATHHCSTATCRYALHMHFSNSLLCYYWEGTCGCFCILPPQTAAPWSGWTETCGQHAASELCSKQIITPHLKTLN